MLVIFRGVEELAGETQWRGELIPTTKRRLKGHTIIRQKMVLTNYTEHIIH